jgi:hypothetical protein
MRIGRKETCDSHEMPHSTFFANSIRETDFLRARDSGHSNPWNTALGFADGAEPIKASFTKRGMEATFVDPPRRHGSERRMLDIAPDGS